MQLNQDPGDGCKMLFTGFLPPDCARCFSPGSLQFAGFLVSYLSMLEMCAGLGGIVVRGCALRSLLGSYIHQELI